MQFAKQPLRRVTTVAVVEIVYLLDPRFAVTRVQRLGNDLGGIAGR